MDQFSPLFGDRRGTVRYEPEELVWSVVFTVSRRLTDDAVAEATRHWEYDGTWGVELRVCTPPHGDTGEPHAQLQRYARIWCAAAGVKATRTPRVRRLR